jgi:hypothetical protein
VLSSVCLHFPPGRVASVHVEMLDRDSLVIAVEIFVLSWFKFVVTDLMRQQRI